MHLTHSLTPSLSLWQGRLAHDLAKNRRTLLAFLPPGADASDEPDEIGAPRATRRARAAPGGPCAARSPRAGPSPSIKWTRRVPHPVLSGHAASLTPY